jgi:hypothetical protein
MSNIRKRLDKVLATLNDETISKEAFSKFKEITPERTGNAKNKTRLRGNTIEANYPYATVLDRGRHMTNRGARGSDLAPEGMSKPTIEHIRKFVNKKLGIKI